MFGIDYKMEGKTLDLTINTDGIDDRWKDILETGEKKVVIRFVREGEEPPDGGSGDNGDSEDDLNKGNDKNAGKGLPEIIKPAQVGKRGYTDIDTDDGVSEAVDDINSLNDISTDGIDGASEALGEVYNKATQLQNFDWADLKNKIDIFGPKEGGEGGEGDTPTGSGIDVTINPIAEQALLDLIYGETLERNLVVNV